MKRRKDRNEALQLPEEADAGSLLALGMREFKNGNIDIAVSFITKAYIIKNFLIKIENLNFFNIIVGKFQPSSYIWLLC